MKKEPIKPRNRHAVNPLMRKGGIHKKTKSAERSRDKANLRKELKVTDLSSFFMADAMKKVIFQPNSRLISI